MPVRHVMLGLLSWKPMHGYLLRQHVQEYSWIYPMSNTNVYPALHSLEQDGFIEYKSEIHDGRARKVYRVTQEGVAELLRWLSEKPNEGIVFRDTLLLKISMMGDPAVDAASGWVAEVIGALREEIESSERHLAKAEMGRYARLVTEYGTDMIRLRLSFLEKVLAAAGDSESARG